MAECLHLAGRVVGAGRPCLIIAEAGVNHNGDVELAHRLVDAAHRAGADVVKFQSFVTEELITPDAPKAGYQVRTTGGGGTQFEMLQGLELRAAAHRELMTHCEDVGILYFCTPYDRPSVDMLDRLGVCGYKIASTDTTNTPLLRYIAGKGRPVILSTGMSNLGEVEEAVRALEAGAIGDEIGIMHCTSEYPAPPNEANLLAIGTLDRSFGYPVGFSDHTEGITVAPWAVALGACMIEKHFTLSRTMEGPDHQASLEPDGLTELVRSIRSLESALGDGIKRPTSSELPNRPLMRKSLVVRRRIQKGETLTESDLTAKRPGTGLRPALYEQVIGQKASRIIESGEVLTMSSIEWSP